MHIIYNFIKKNIGVCILICLLFLHTYISLHNANSVISLIYFLLCISGICVLTNNNSKVANVDLYYIKYGVFFAITIFFVYFTSNAIIAQPLHYKDADMLPVIQKMSERFINGEQVYAPIPEIWSGMQPIYMPAMWLPYTVPTILHIDIRWLNIMAVLVCFLLVFISTTTVRQLIVATLFYMLSCYYFTSIYKNYLLYTQESITIMYVSLLYYGIYNKNWKTIFIAFTLCVCSRYWIVVSLPFLLLQYKQERHNFFSHIWPSAVLVLFFIIITPLQQYNVWLGLPRLYQAALQDEGNSFKYTSVINKFGLVKILPNAYRHTITTIGLLFTLGSLLYLTIVHKKNNNYLLLVFTITIVCMLLFMIIPYEYLMYTILVAIFLSMHYTSLQR
jgi:hypothetical protein